MTADQPGTELAVIGNAEEIAALPAAQRGELITHALLESKQWLAVATKGTDPTPIAEFKAWAATVAEMTRQKNLSKEIQDDATEMVRRAERGIGVAIRNGQLAGEIETTKEAQSRASNIAKGRIADPKSKKPRALDFATTNELHSSYSNILDLTDDVDDEQFEDAITEARSEGNLGRVNVVRKINSMAGVEVKSKRDQRIVALAREGYRSSEIAAKVKLHEDTVRKILKEFNVVNVADRLTSRTHRHIDHDRIVRETVIGLEGTAMSLQMLDLTQLKDLTEIDYWIESIGSSMKAVTLLRKQLKEMIKE